MLINKEQSYAIVGAAMEVYKTLRDGFTEYVYQDALEVELRSRGIPYEREKQLRVIYKGVQLAHEYYADFVCYDGIIVELKAVSELTVVHRAQVLNYLKATGYKLGILINFGQSGGIEYERIVN